MPASCCEPDYDAAFDDRTARRQLARYRRAGPWGSTRRLIEALRGPGVDGASLLDIGGGVGVIGLELLQVGAASVTDVDASQPYIGVAREEFARRGFADRATFHAGNFVTLAPEIEAHDLVTLDRVVCCYGDWPALIDAATARTRRRLGLVYPNDRWWMRLAIGASNLCARIMRQSYRGYVHSERGIDARIREAGFVPATHHRGWVWQTVVYERVSAP